MRLVWRSIGPISFGLVQKTSPGLWTDLLDGVPEETKEEIEDIQRGL